MHSCPSPTEDRCLSEPNKTDLPCSTFNLVLFWSAFKFELKQRRKFRMKAFVFSLNTRPVGTAVTTVTLFYVTSAMFNNP